MEKLHALRDIKIIKAVIGVRRCGKSTLLEMFAKELAKKYAGSGQIHFFNLEEAAYTNYENWLDLYSEIDKKLIADKMNYVFIDEIQGIKNFEKLIDGLHIKKNVDLYVTGSNAYLLSSELATILSGRAISIEILPFSFAEFSEAYKNPKGDSTKFC